jgi:hypothetical protein
MSHASLHPRLQLTLVAPPSPAARRKLRRGSAAGPDRQPARPGAQDRGVGGQADRDRPPAGGLPAPAGRRVDELGGVAGASGRVGRAEGRCGERACHPAGQRAAPRRTTGVLRPHRRAPKGASLTQTSRRNARGRPERAPPSHIPIISRDVPRADARGEGGAASCRGARARRTLPGRVH